MPQSLTSNFHFIFMRVAAPLLNVS
jgi:hypothetical protein